MEKSSESYEEEKKIFAQQLLIKFGTVVRILIH